jgi:hypothetical protein
MKSQKARLFGNRENQRFSGTRQASLSRVSKSLASSSQGISQTAVIYLALGAIVILIFMLFIGQQRGKTEETIFTKIWNKFFPETTETVIIKGTTVGKTGCALIEITDANHLAQSMVDCWVKAENIGEYPCCYRINPKKLTAAVTQEQVKKELMTKGETGRYIATATCSDFVWKVGTVNPADGEFKVCYDEDGCNEVSVTRGISDTDCDD